MILFITITVFHQVALVKLENVGGNKLACILYLWPAKETEDSLSVLAN